MWQGKANRQVTWTVFWRTLHCEAPSVLGSGWWLWREEEVVWESFIHSGMLEKTTTWSKDVSLNVKSQCNCNLNVRKRLFLKNSCSLAKYIILHLLTFFSRLTKLSMIHILKFYSLSISWSMHCNLRLCVSRLWLPSRTFLPLGWPSFHDVINSDAVAFTDDFSYGMHRVETSCSQVS